MIDELRIGKGEAIAPGLAQEFDALEVLDAFVAVMRRRYQAQRGAVGERQGLAFEAVGQQNVVSEQIGNRQRAAIAIQPVQNDAHHILRYAVPGHAEIIEISEAHAGPGHVTH